MLPRSSPAVLAEVLLSGLIVKVGGSPDRPEYDFILGARRALDPGAVANSVARIGSGCSSLDELV